MLELVRGYATAAFDVARKAGRLEKATSDLVAIAQLLVTSESLRIVLTDASVPAGNRVAVLRDLLASKVAPEALGPVVFSVETERATEVPRTVEQLVEMAESAQMKATAGEPPGAEPPIGRSGAYERIRGYADRVFELVPSPRDVNAIEDELFRLARLAESTPSLLEVVADTTVPVEGRTAVLDDLLQDKVRSETARLAAYTVRAGRARSFVASLDYLVELAAVERGRRIAHVRSALDLDANERERLSEALSRITRRPVELRVRVDPSVIGGLSVQVGDIVIDGTIRHRLAQLRESLLQSA